MADIYLITGGARSGKSSFALKLAKELHKEVIFLATAQAKDKEMQERIASHKKNRPSSWQTVEESVKVNDILKQYQDFPGIILIDCLTLWISNLLDQKSESEIIAETEKLLQEAKDSPATLILVTNEVGMGIVPPTESGREFRDIAGKVNQLAAAQAKEVYLIVSGVPVKVK